MKSLILLLLWVFVALGIAWRNGYFKISSVVLMQKPRLLLRDVIGIFAFFLIVQLVLVPSAVFLYNYFLTGSWGIDAQEDVAWINVFGMVGSIAAILVFCFFLEPKTRGLLSTGGWKKWKRDFALGALSWLICFPVVSMVAQIFALALNAAGVSGEVDQVAVRYLKGVLNDPLLFWVSFWLIIFVVPFVEEVLFRGFLQTWLRQRTSAVKGVAVTSAVFAAFHFSLSQGWHNADLLAALFLLSCFMGFLYEKTGSLWAPASLHMTFNAISEVAIIAQEGGVAS